MKTQEKMMTIEEFNQYKRITIEEFNQLKEKVKRLEIGIWKIQNPPKFSNDDEVVYKMGPTNGKYHRAKVVKIEFIKNSYSPEMYWRYSLWDYSLKEVVKYDGESRFYNAKHVKIRKYETDSDS